MGPSFRSFSSQASWIGVLLALPAMDAAASATPLGGRVVFAGWSSAGYGNLLVIENNGWQVYLGHNSSFLVGVGEVVRAGQAVALSGSTGNSSGPHVHFEVRECMDGYCTPRHPERVLLPGQSAYCAWSSLPGTCGD